MQFCVLGWIIDVFIVSGSGRSCVRYVSKLSLGFYAYIASRFCAHAASVVSYLSSKSPGVLLVLSVGGLVDGRVLAGSSSWAGLPLWLHR